MAGLNVTSPETSSGGHHVAPAGTTSDQASMGGTGATGNPYIDSLLQGSAWVGAITYSFPDARNDYEATYAEADAAGFGQVSFNQMQAARYILEGFSPYVGGPRMGLTSVESITNASLADAGFNRADIRVATSSYANPTAYAYYPTAGNGYYAGDVWFGTSYNYGNAQVGNYQYATMLHELGHSLGLKHAQDAGGVSNTSMPADRDSLEFTVMTYRSYIGGPTSGYTNETYGFPQTYMMYDIAALQAIYGANFNTNAGNTVYTWSPATGETFVNSLGQGVPGSGISGSANRIFLTIWDGGGIDTYDLSNYATNQSVDLSPGGWSLFSNVQRANLGDGNYARGNVFNALQYQGDARSLIENAFGGSGHDTITGNTAANELRGNTGDDRLYGGFGVDTLAGGAGSDYLDGGADYDIAAYTGTAASYAWIRNTDSTWSVTDLRAGSPDGIDTLISIEQLRFSDESVALVEPNSAAPTFTRVSLGFASAGWRIADVTDLTGDGKADLLWENDWTGEVFYWGMDGTQRTSAGSLGFVGAGWNIVDTVDLTGDGGPDLLWQNDQTGEVFYWGMNGTQRTSGGSLGFVSAGWKIADTTDLTGDGRPDLLWHNVQTGEVYYWGMNGTLRTSTGSLGFASAGWRIADAADLTGDGKADLVWENAQTGEAFYWGMNGTQRTSGGSLGFASAGSRIADTVDLTGDGSVDLLWENDRTGEVFYWGMDGSQRMSAGSLGFVSADWNIADTADLNVDGKVDLVWHNARTGEAYSWLLT
jgi:predicted RecA/RadA family phage recombinase